jgi:hypothetical protein
MTQPATDEQIAEWAAEAAEAWDMSSDVVESLIARIRAEQAKAREKVAAMMIRNSIATGHGDTIDDLLAELEAHLSTAREQAIRECIDVATELLNDDEAYAYASEIKDALSDLLPSPSTGEETK